MGRERAPRLRVGLPSRGSGDRSAFDGLPREPRGNFDGPGASDLPVLESADGRDGDDLDRLDLGFTATAGPGSNTPAGPR